MKIKGGGRGFNYCNQVPSKQGRTSAEKAPVVEIPSDSASYSTNTNNIYDIFTGPIGASN